MVCEPYYYVYNSEGTQVFYVPHNCNPADSCRSALWSLSANYGAVDGYVFNYDGLAIAGAMIIVEDGPTTTSGPDGYYLLEGANRRKY